MPRSAIDTGLVDLILPAAAMPGRLYSLSEGVRRLPRSVGEAATEEADFAQLLEIFARVRERTGHDFSQYKRPTLLRRIARRMQLHLLPGISAYLRFLDERPDEVPALVQDLSQAKRGGERITVASRWVLHHNERGEPESVLEANHDISDRKRAEDALGAADRRKNEFLAMLAHELRNPLAAVLSSLELFDDAADDEGSQLHAREVMGRQLKLLVRLVDDLLDPERLARGKVTLRMERLDVARAVNLALGNHSRHD